MAKLYTGNINFSVGIKQKGAVPLDDRTVVETFNDLLNSETFGLSAYEGMLVAVMETQKVYMLVDKNNSTAAESWTDVGGLSEKDIENELNKIDEIEKIVTGHTETIETIQKQLSSTVNYGNALEISSGTVNVLVAKDNNYLKINEENELIVSEMNTDDTVFSEDITIAGGPLAELAKQAYTGGTVPQGTSIQEFFKNLLCVEIYPTATTTTGSYNIEISTPTISANVSSESLQEVGTKVNFNAVIAKPITENKTNPKVTGFEYGYSDTINGAIIEGPTSVITTISSSQKSGEVYKLTGTKSGFEGNIQESANSTTYSSCTLSATTLTVALGTNSYTVVEMAPKYTYSYSGIDSKYIVSNLGGRNEDNKSEAVAAKSATDSNQPTASTTFTVTGVYPVYTNSVSSTVANTTTVEKRCTLSSGKSFEIDFGSETLAFNAFAYPATHSLSTVEIYNEDARKYEEYIGGSETVDATYTVQGTAISYKTWKRKGSAYGQTTKFRFTLNKNLNTK